MNGDALDLEAVNLHPITGGQMRRERAELADRLPQPGQVRALRRRREEWLDRAEIALIHARLGRAGGLLDGRAHRIFGGIPQPRRMTR